jgi:hypothetical protein
MKFVCGEIGGVMLHDSFAEAARLGGRSRKPGAQRLGYSIPPRLGNFTADSESSRAYTDLLVLTNVHKMARV